LLKRVPSKWSLTGPDAVAPQAASDRAMAAIDSGFKRATGA
jgi:hypothetical protein